MEPLGVVLISLVFLLLVVYPLLCKVSHFSESRHKINLADPYVCGSILDPFIIYHDLDCLNFRLWREGRCNILREVDTPNLYGVDLKTKKDNREKVAEDLVSFLEKIGYHAEIDEDNRFNYRIVIKSNNFRPNQRIGIVGPL